MADKLDARTVAAALSKRLAAHKINDETVKLLAKQVVAAKLGPIDINICQFGICIDYLVPRPSLGELLNRLEKDTNFGSIKIFPKGIINPDSFLVSVEHQLPR